MTDDSGFELDARLAADTVALCDGACSRFLLMNDAHYPWLVLVPRRPRLRDLDDLAAADMAVLTAEIAAASRALRSLFAPGKINVAALGNVVAQLHVHVIARRDDDAAWPRPVWGAVPARPYAAGALQRRAAALRGALARELAGG
jgi:diadenosine tetraphosphate (Ap4A) HIT family hydrolase